VIDDRSWQKKKLLMKLIFNYLIYLYIKVYASVNISIAMVLGTPALETEQKLAP
jgi:hypothetical protein